MTRARLDPVLADLRGRLVPWVRALADNSPPDRDFRGRTFAAEPQWQLARGLLRQMGFDFDRGRLDGSTHPFTTMIGAGDIRLTIRTREDDPTESVLTTLHEGGHALYDQGFLKEDRHSLIGDAPSMGLHECNARLWENHVGRSEAFWRFLLPTLRENLGDVAAGLDIGAYLHAVARVRASTNRTLADEMSYHLHIILRYELEQALIAGELKVSELRRAWNEKSRNFIGVEPQSDLEGVLQDSHWSGGMFGYFPTYTIGSLYAAQLVESYARSHPLEDEVSQGMFTPLLGWLRTHIHAHGHRYPSEELVTRATGTGLDAAAFFRHLTARYGAAPG